MSTSRKKIEATNFGKPVSLDSITSDILSIISQDKRKVRKRLQHFNYAFNDKFPQNNNERAVAMTLLWALMDVPLTLYAMNMIGPAILEIHSILERYVLRSISQIISNKQHYDMVFKSLERRTLSDFGPFLLELQVIDKKDLKHIEKLSTLRNGVAHKNAKKIANVVTYGREIHLVDIDEVVKRIDFISVLINSLKIFTKLYNTTKDYPLSPP